MTISRDFLAKIQNHTPTLVPNRRLAHHLQLAAADGTAVWDAFPVYTLKDFIIKTAEQEFFRRKSPCPGRILDSFEELLCWQKIISADENTTLKDNGKIAHFARSAWKTALEWRIDIHSIGNQTYEFKQFKIWLQRYLDFCKAQNAADFFQVFTTIIDYDYLTGISGQEINFAGFIKTTPLLEHFIAKHEIKACFATRANNSIKSRVEALNPETEEKLAASWACNLVKKGAKKICIVVPDLAKRKDNIVNALIEVIEPDNLGLKEKQKRDSFFNVSQGTGLSELEMTGAALNMLRFVISTGKLPYDFISALIRSRYFCLDEQELDFRARLDVEIRELIRPQVSLRKFVAIAQSLAADDPWLKSLAGIKPHRGRFSLTKHAAFFAETLTTLNFPGMYGKSGRDHHILTSLYRVWEKLSGLDRLAGKLNLHDALKLLQQICDYEMFQPKSGFEEKISIMQPNEALGIRFEHTWFMGMDDKNFPGRVYPNPLLPISVLKEKGVSGASAECMLADARKMLDQLESSTEELVYSSCAQDNGEEFAPSHLSLKYPLLEFDVAEKSKSLEKFEKKVDDKGPVFGGNRLESAVNFIADQAVCPLMAYAKHRLKAQYPPQPLAEFSSLERGRIIHESLERIYREAGESDKINNESNIKKHINFALKRVEKRLGRYEKNARVLEVERGYKIISSWLAFDNKRMPFQVHALEKLCELVISGLNIRLKLDRIDKIDEEMLVIDYKTGNLTKIDWHAPRLSSPQLPLYALAVDKAGAVAYANLKPDDIRITTFGALTTGLEKRGHKVISREDWDKLKTDWRKNITALVEEIKRGEAFFIADSQEDVINSDACGFCRIYPD